MQIAAVLSLPVAPSSAAHIFFMVFIVENWATALLDMKHDVLICYLLSPWQLCHQWCWLFFSCCCFVLFFFPICCAALALVFLNVFVWVSFNANRRPNAVTHKSAAPQWKRHCMSELDLLVGTASMLTAFLTRAFKIPWFVYLRMTSGLSLSTIHCFIYFTLW